MSSPTPKTANDKLKSMTESIVRHRIANSKIAEIIKNRNDIKNTIKKELREVVEGWGVWLETVEIIDVTVLSSNLFSDL